MKLFDFRYPICGVMVLILFTNVAFTYGQGGLGRSPIVASPTKAIITRKKQNIAAQRPKMNVRPTNPRKKKPSPTVINSLPFKSSTPELKYTTHYNPRFNYALIYPENLLRLDNERHNGDVYSFRSFDGSTELTTFGSRNLLGRKLRDIFNEELQNSSGKGFRVTYKVIRGKFFVVSGFTSDERIFYRKTIYKSAKNSFISFIIESPVAQKYIYDAVTTRISHNFRG